MLSDYRAFLTQFLRNYQTTGSVVPSGRALSVHSYFGWTCHCCLAPLATAGLPGGRNASSGRYGYLEFRYAYPVLFGGGSSRRPA